MVPSDPVIYCTLCFCSEVFQCAGCKFLPRLHGHFTLPIGLMLVTCGDGVGYTFPAASSDIRGEQSSGEHNCDSLKMEATTRGFEVSVVDALHICSFCVSPCSKIRGAGCLLLPDLDI